MTSAPATRASAMRRSIVSTLRSGRPGLTSIWTNAVAGSVSGMDLGYRERTRGATARSWGAGRRLFGADLVDDLALNAQIVRIHVDRLHRGVRRLQPDALGLAIEPLERRLALGEHT